MTRLGLTVPWHEDETVVSYCSRLAAANGIENVKDFCGYFSLNHRKIVASDLAEIDKLLQLTGAGSAAGRLFVRDGWFFEINGERLAKHSVTRNPLRYCPHCLSEDFKVQRGPLGTRGYGRLSWCISFLRTCPKHHVLLRVAQHDAPYSGDDVVRLIAAEMRAVDVRKAEESYMTTEFERFIATALWGRRDALGWIDQFPLYVVGRMSELIGLSVLCGKVYYVDDLTDADVWIASQVGFAIMKGGKDHFEDFLKSMHADFWLKKTHTGGRALYGRLYERLANETKDPAYDPIKKIIYDVTLDSLPFGPGDELFGRVTERRNHSVHSAAQEFKIHPKTLRKLLLNANVPGMDVLTDERIVLPKDQMVALVDRLSGDVSGQDAAEYLGVTRTLWSTLVRDRHVKTAAGEHTTGMYDLYKIADLDAFLAKILSMANTSFDPALGLVALGTVVKRANCTFSEILTLLFQGRLQTVSVHPGGRRMDALLFDTGEIKRLTELPDHGRFRMADASRVMGVPRNTLTKLIKANRVKASISTNPSNRCKQCTIELSVMENFKAEYISLFNLAKQHRMKIDWVQREFAAIGILPAISSNEVGTTFYRRSDFVCPIH